MDGRAIDFNVFSFGTPYDVCQAIIAAGIEFDQLIHEFGRWVHLSIPKEGEAPRKQCLTIRPGSTIYELGVRII